MAFFMTATNIKLTPSEMQRQGYTYNPIPDSVRRLIIETAGDRGLSLYMEATSHAKSFVVTAKMLASRLNWNAKTVTKYLALLRDLGLATLRKIRKTGGIFTGSRWLFSHVPQEDWKKMAEQQHDFFDDRDTNTPTVQKAVTERITTKNKTKINLTSAQASPERVAASDKDRQQAFERFYSKYPKKIDRLRAQSAFKRLTAKMTLPELDAFTEKLWQDVHRRTTYADQWLKGVIPSPKSYLNGEKWNDELKPRLTEQTKGLQTFVEMGGTVDEYLTNLG